MVTDNGWYCKDAEIEAILYIDFYNHANMKYTTHKK